MNFENNSERPQANPKGGTLGAEDIELRWEGRHPEAAGKMNQIFEIVKEKPFETIGLSVFVWFTSVIVVILVEMALALIPILLFEDGLDIVLEDTVNQTTSYALYEGATSLLSSIFSVSTELMVWATLSIVWLRIFRRQPVQASHLAEIIPFLPRVIGCALVLSTIAHFGLFFLIVPGVIFWLGFTMAPFLIVDKNLGILESMKASWIITKGHKAEIFALNFYIILLNMAGALACGLGLFITVPMSYGMIASFYNDLVVPGNAYKANDLDEDIFR